MAGQSRYTDTLQNPDCPRSAIRQGRCIVTIGVWLVLMVVPFASASDELQFNRDIRPILSDNCFACHGQDANKREAELRLDDASTAIESGAIVPNDAKNSELMARLNSTDPDLVMPPPNSNRKLTARQKQQLADWINSGAKFERHWAFESPIRPEPPVVKNTGWVRNPIDQFVLAKLETIDLRPSPPAEKATLIKRLFIDLTGLPPTPDEVYAFVTDTDPDAYANLVDRLLDSEHYGERMALPWLDAARYADSNGFQQDGDTWQWIWRDWVVRALNDDLPFDKFTIWQLAGDLLPDATIDQKIASGFNRNHLLNGEGGAIAEEQRWVNLFDRMDTTSTTWLGLTMACAQCHDHKYDPITQEDYYSLLDAFNRVPERGTPQRFSTRIRVDAPFLELPTEENKKRIAEFEAKINDLNPVVDAMKDAAFAGWRAGILSGEPAKRSDLAEAITALLAKPAQDRNDEEKKQLESELRKYFDENVSNNLAKEFKATKDLEKTKRDLAGYRGDQIPRVMIMSDDKPRETSILSRGEYLKPTVKVAFNTPKFLPAMDEGAAKSRLGFARWLVSDDHPLTARVQVNRMWQYFFGQGLVKTSEDFGVQSEYPVHRELLDWLAVELRESGWSMKRMHRLIVMSSTYRQASRVTAKHLEVDSENRYYARASRFRMPSMILRDWALATSGLLKRELGGAPVYPYQPDDVWEALAITKERDFTYPASSGDSLYRRSLYTFWRRTVQPTNMFDASNRQACRVRQSNTSTPLHALTTLNDRTWVEAARVLAQRVLKSELTPTDGISTAFRLVVCREPTMFESKQLAAAYEKQAAIYEADNDAANMLLAVGESKRDENIDPVRHAAMTAVCLGIMNLDEALTRE